MLILILAFLTLSILILGILSMAKGGKFNKRYGNRLMMMRVTFQLLTIILLFALFAVS